MLCLTQGVIRKHDADEFLLALGPGLLVPTGRTLAVHIITKGGDTDEEAPCPGCAFCICVGSILLKWFYPGSFTGHEFVYSKQEAMELAQDKQDTIVVNQQIVPNFRIAGAGR